METWRAKIQQQLFAQNERTRQSDSFNQKRKINSLFSYKIYSTFSVLLTYNQSHPYILLFYHIMISDIIYNGHTQDKTLTASILLKYLNNI